MDLKAYQTQIIELIPLRNEPDFNDLLNKILFGESASDKFLIKMELSRLAKPCQRILDIRDKVTEKCDLVEQDKLKHYLTKPTTVVLQKNITLYGLYTVGVYEAVHAYIALEKIKKKSQQRSPETKVITQEQCELITLSQKNKRGAPRMFFVSDITITLSDGKALKAHTSNISLSGVKLKLKEHIQFQPQTLMSLTFSGLDLEYHEKVLKEPITYQLVKQESDADDSHYLYLNYADDKQRFLTFMSEFIRLNQYKYKIDVHYYYQLAKISALKQSYLAQMNTLPICLDAHAPSPFIFALKNKINQQLLNEWHCEGVNQLNFLFNELRLIKLIASMQTLDSTTIYTFTHTVKGKQYFLSASEEELIEKDLKHTFINYGRSKSNWRVYHLTLSDYQYQTAKRQQVAEPVPAIFKKVTHMATLQRLSKAYPFVIDEELSKSDVNQLNQFVHRNENTIAPTPVFTLFSTEQRKEARYLYSSNLSVADKKSAYNGKIIDFSYTGLKIKLNQITAFSTSTKLTVNLTELQKISKKFALSNLQYKVVRTGANNILHLQVCDKKTLDICQQFFSVLVKNNAKHFTCRPLKEKQQPPGKHLIEVAEESFTNTVFFISKIGARHKITFAAMETTDHPLHALFSMFSDNKHEVNYSPLANNQLYERLITQPLKASEAGSLNKEALIYIKVVKDEKQQLKVSSFLDEDFKSDQAKATFIRESQFNASFYALHYRLTPLPNVDIDSIKNEVRAISRFAIHLTKKLEEELHAVEAMIEITDRTADIISTVEKKEVKLAN
ncbi:PilZ domain-containing protein [Psychromonas sp. Urea-02u-13]|uniref:PilZ domain-containing protein n=1 Tax=Psychromonas sp. Urea-02u-13 TaxID=2058326 RepID=UPI000C31CD45|nr:PilZ domain-containing protein [Psychromonas sp. Urea-02u-13]PKG39318.1 hypothetical protein CXF74_09160 [Psychromonas sp. Urea-02u-13]